MNVTFFNAVDIELGYCDSPECKSVHIQLLDAAGICRARAVISCDSIDEFVADLIATRDKRLAADRVGGLH